MSDVEMLALPAGERFLDFITDVLAPVALQRS